jgi:DNA-binding transcriptional regulator YbjK
VYVVVGGGLQGLTHRAVAEKLGIAHARVVYHYPTVVDLRKATLHTAGHRIVNQLGELMPADTSAVPLATHVPDMAGHIATMLITDLHDETVTLFTLMAEATRNPELRQSVQGVTARAAALIEPLSQDRELANLAASAFLGLVMTTMAKNPTCDPATLRTQVVQLIEHFDPFHPKEK